MRRAAPALPVASGVAHDLGPTGWPGPVRCFEGLVAPRTPRLVEFLWRLLRCLLYRKPASVKTVKICLALNRAKVANPQAVWELGNLSWRQILRGKVPLAL
jgi:hypothetical protein